MNSLLKQVQIDEVLLAVIVVAVLLAVLTILLVLTIRSVNVLTKKNFIEKLQEYDSLVDERQTQLTTLNEEIETRKVENEQLALEAKKIAKKQAMHGINNSIGGKIVMPRTPSLVSDDIWEQYRKIKKNFSFDVVTIVRQFIREHPENREKTQLYRVYYKMRRILNFEAVFKLSTFQNEEQRRIVRRLFGQDAQYLEDLLSREEFNISDVVGELDDFLSTNDPRVFVLVPDEDINYNYIDQRVVTRFDPTITEGFRIMYQGTYTDYSI